MCDITSDEVDEMMMEMYNDNKISSELENVKVELAEAQAKIKNLQA